MLRKTALSVVGALGLLLALTFAVMGQDADAAAEAPRVEPASAVVTQTAPLSLTIIVPGPDGTQTVTVPVFLNLDLRIDISSALTASVAATATASLTATEVATPAAAAPEATAAPTEAPAPEPTAEPTEEPSAESTEESDAVAAPAEDASIDDSAVSTETIVSGLALLAVCPNENVRITSPAIGATLSGTVAIEGTADNADFQYYKVEYIAGDAPPAYLGGGEAPVVAGTLSEFDTQELADGPYSLLLTVVDNSGNFPDPCAIAVTIENE